jgi:hypothetical protein
MQTELRTIYIDGLEQAVSDVVAAELWMEDCHIITRIQAIFRGILGTFKQPA